MVLEHHSASKETRRMQVIKRRALLGGAATMSLTGPALATDSSWDTIAVIAALRVGVIAARPPYFWRENGEWTGFCAQMGRDLAAALGKQMAKSIEVEFVETTWGTVILDIQASRIDVFFGLSYSEQRDQAINLFGPLYALPEVLLTSKGFTPKDASWAALDKPENRFSVVLGTTDQQAAQRLLPHAQIRAMKGMAEAEMDVQAGYGQAMVTTALVGLGAMKDSPNFGQMLVPQPTLTQPSHGGTRRDGDGRFGAYLRDWANEYRGSGRAKEVILASMRSYGLDVDKLPPAVAF
jgi:polar amino acid transport system substrate-binding protein